VTFSDWSVYLIYNCRHTKPPKNKYSVIFNFPVGFYGFLINSEIHPFIQKRNHLLPCIADIFCKTNNFLQHDSFIDCREMFDFDAGEIKLYKGEVCEQTKQNIIKAVTACPALELKYKNHLLGKYGGLINY